LTARLLRLRQCMQARSHIGIRAAFPTETGYSLAAAGYWKSAIIVIAAAVSIMLLIMQPGKAARVERGVEVAFTRAWQLLHEADKENRNVRPLPLSVAAIEVQLPVT
jgi:hypothetical protein